MRSVLMVASWDWTLDKFRLALAESLREEGYEITFVCADGKYVDRFEDRGFRWVEWKSKRKRLNPFAELRAFLELADIYAKEQPDLIHHDTIKPNLYGPLALKLNQLRGRMDALPPVINTFMGLGYVFSDGLLPRAIRTLINPFLSFGVNQANVNLVFSNRSDQDRLRRHGILRHERTSVLMSEFVDTEKFRPFSPVEPAPEVVDEPPQAPVVLMAVRLLWAKGVGEFVEAAQILQRRGVDVHFWLAGEPDTDSAGFVPEDQLREWEEEGLIEWLGYQTDMPTLFNQADIATLPTKYNEGMPRFLVEAAACGLPIVTTDQEACRIVVNDEENGIIIPTGDSEALADALERLVTDRDYRRTLGQKARTDAVRDFDEETGTEEWHQLYDRLLTEASSVEDLEYA
ncbi:glycosyltransferase family 4 protein [Salinibacter ruber]|uniref:glycosyltransferase family 4 protein n=1 Tax=Salinibacter ruber TaxID=146919 RepID=UPI002168A4F8|nr:glycosyltransferase family 4 protein [Salinibacter ruber]MCS4174783.1 glycosyltransferase involved in cell wall biosynthesis [Salinibacter ruber]